MPQEEIVYQTKVKYSGIFSFKDFYKFMYDWLTDESGLTVKETKYEEKIGGNAKNVAVEWSAEKKLNDYFKNKISLILRITNMEDVEVNESGVKVKVNKGSVDLGVKGVLISDYDGKWEKSAWMKFWRGIYEKYVIPAQLEQYKDRLTGATDEFSGQMKAYLALEGKK